MVFVTHEGLICVYVSVHRGHKAKHEMMIIRRQQQITAESSAYLLVKEEFHKICLYRSFIA